MERRAGSTGYVVVVLGAVAFVVGLFLPYYEYEVSPGSLSLYRLTMFERGELVTSVSGGLYLFGGIATLAWIALAGVRTSEGWTRPALAAVTVAWSLTWMGLLLGASRFGTPLLVGYWVLFLSVIVIVIGTIMVLVAARRDVAKLDAPQPTS